MNQILDQHTQDERMILDLVAADEPVESGSIARRLALHNLAEQGLIRAAGDHWALTPRGLHVIQTMRRQALIAGRGAA